MNSHDLAARIAALEADLAGVEAERGLFALQAESGVVNGPSTMAGLNERRASVSAALEQARLAHKALLREEEKEAVAARQRSAEARRVREMRFGDDAVAKVRSIDSHILAAVQELRDLAALHAEYQGGGYPLPQAVTEAVRSFPRMVQDMLAGSGVFGFSNWRLPGQTSVNGSPWTGALQSVYPPAESFVQTER
ncbi:hypothetical protein [Dongia sp. agr-C8]